MTQRIKERNSSAKAIAYRLLGEPDSRVYVFTSTYFKASAVLARVEQELKGLQRAGMDTVLKVEKQTFEYHRKHQHLYIKAEHTHASFMVLPKDLSELSGIQCTNIWWDRDLYKSFDKALPFLTSRLRSGNYAGMFSILPLLE